MNSRRIVKGWKLWLKQQRTEENSKVDKLEHGYGMVILKLIYEGGLKGDNSNLTYGEWFKGDNCKLTYEDGKRDR